MSTVHCFTSASFTYLDRVRILRQTLQQFHPDWVFWLCLADTEPPGFVFDPSAENIDHVVRVDELRIPDLQRWLFQHDLVELCTAVKGPMLRRLLEAGAEKVIYLDPDIALFSPLDEVVWLLDRHDVVLTPHQVQPDEESAVIADNEIASLKHGIYNLGFLAVARKAEGLCFARWWCNRLLEFCFDDIPNGLFTDQRWCDHAPVFFPSLHILRDPGYNVASWNLSRRPLSIEHDGSIRAAGRLLRFFHFTKITWVGERMLERYSGGSMAVFELIKWYREQLAVHTVIDLPAQWWAFGRYTDGSEILREHRIAYRTRPELRQRFAHPFTAGPGSLAEHLALPALTA